MAAASYSSDVLQMFYGPIPMREKRNIPELLEKIYKECDAIKKIREKKEIGWDEVHDEIKEAPFCEKRSRITKVTFCRNCTLFHINGLCFECYKNRENHYLDYPYPTYGTYNEKFQKFY